MSKDLTRRSFIKASGTLAGMAFFNFGLGEALARDPRDHEWKNGQEEWVVSTCHLCPGACGIRVRVVDGDAVKIEGNPYHPVNRGTLCPKGQAGLQLLYNDKRIQQPVMRDKRGQGAWKAVSWDDALQMLADRLAALRQDDRSEALCVVEQYSNGSMQRLLRRFMEAFGSPNHVPLIDPGRVSQVFRLMHGLDNIAAFDLENTSLLLSFNTELLEGWWSPTQAARAYAHLRRGRQGGGARIVHVGPHLTATATRADEWIPILPGTEGAFALGIAYVLIKEGLIDKRFVEAHTTGFGDISVEGGEDSPGFRRLVLKNYRPDAVSRITGVPVSRIITLAKEFGAERNPLAVFDQSTMRGAGGTFNGLAVHSLNALKGNLDKPGGVLVQREFPQPDWKHPKLDERAMAASSRPRLDRAGSATLPLAPSSPVGLASSLIEGRPYKPEVVVFHELESIQLLPGGEALDAALRRVPFTVAISSHLSDVCEHADLVLPVPTYLERIQDNRVTGAAGFPIVGITQPVVKPRFDTMHPGDILLGAASRLGGAVAEALPWKSYQEVFRLELQSLYEDERGIIFSNPFETSQIRILEERGWWKPAFDSFKAFEKEILTRGGWWDPAYTYEEWGRVFRNRHRKFAFYAYELEEALQGIAGGDAGMDGLLKELGLGARGGEAFLPHSQSLPRQEDADTLEVVTFEPLLFSFGTGAGQEWLVESIGFRPEKLWNTWVEINPSTANRLSIHDDDLVRIESQFGSIRARARLYAGTMPGVIALPMGFGRVLLAKDGRRVGEDAGRLLGLRADPLSGMQIRSGARARLVIEERHKE